MESTSSRERLPGLRLRIHGRCEQFPCRISSEL
jgi:hypothetical protein